MGEDRTQGEERRQSLLDLLTTSPKPVPGTELGQRLRATRQTVVQDIAILRARGEPIIATSRGYLLASSLAPNRYRAILAVRHRPEQTEDELSALLDLGLRIVDVRVDHPVYGEMRGMLMLDSKEDLRDWLRVMKEKQAHLLSELTEGIHLHSVESPRADLIEKARQILRERGYLFEGDTVAKG